MTSKEGGQYFGISGRGKYTKNKRRRRNYRRRMWTAPALVMHSGGYKQNKVKTKRFFTRKVRTHAPRAPYNTSYVVPHAPYNTSSYIMRTKRSGGLASLVTPVTPAIIPTPVQSPATRYREGLLDEVNKGWGVNGYGSMNDFIRLRRSMEGADNYKELIIITYKFDSGIGTGESESDLEQDSDTESVQQLERRINHLVSRFEIVYPFPPAINGSKPLNVRMEELEKQIAYLEEEHLFMRRHVYLLQRELEKRED